MKIILMLAIILSVACSTKPQQRAGVEVLAYASDPPLTEEGSWKIEWPGGPISKWTAHVSGDTVVVERRGLCGDECAELHRIVFINRNSSLPRFISYTYAEDHIFPQKMTITDSLIGGTVEIQDWDINSVVSGQVGDGRWLLHDSPPISFWVDLADTKLWVAIDPIQCLGNAWEQDWLASHDNDYDAYPRDEENRLSIFREFYEQQGVAIYETKVSIILEDVCAACGCPTGERIHCLIDEAGLPAMLDWGFVEEH